MRPAAIELRGVGKRFVKYEDTPMLVSRLLQLRNRSRRSSLWALRGATAEVRQGECVAVIGRNGSGKSTLLQMLAGVTAPTEGSVTVHGRVAPLISVGVGFHPELSGRENVYVNGMILGLTRQELDDRLDEIVSFAEIGDFLDTPVKFYSSGMFVRLGFAVSAMAEPDVMLIDEVLAVGDLSFQLKCFDRLESLRASGATIVIVTHNMNAVRRLCERTLVIHDGELRFDGDTVEGLSLYHELLAQPRDRGATATPDEPAVLDVAALTDLTVLAADGRPTNEIDAGEVIRVEALVTLRRAIPEAMLGFSIVNEEGVHAYGEIWPLDSIEGFHPPGTRRVAITVPAALASGSYSLHLNLGSMAHPRIAPSPTPLMVYVTGRAMVQGVADLEARFGAAD